MNKLIVDHFENHLHDSFMGSDRREIRVEIDKGDRTMVATLSLTNGQPLLAVTVLNLVTKLKEYSEVFLDSEQIKHILGHCAVPELIEQPK